MANKLTLKDDLTVVGDLTSNRVLVDNIIVDSNAITSSSDLNLGSGGGSAVIVTSPLTINTSTGILHSSSGGVVSSSAVVLTSEVSGVLPIANGGTNKALTLAAGGLVWTDADSFEVGAAGTGSDWALSGGTGAPTFSSTTTTAKIIDGSADAIQLTVQGHSTQTSNILVVEKSDGTDLLQVTNTAGTAIRGTTTNDAAAAGYVGEYVSSSVSATNFPTTSQYGDLTSISLTAGDWDVVAIMDSGANGATVNEVLLGISTTSGNSATGLTRGDTLIDLGTPLSGVRNAGGSLIIRASISATTTYYLKYAAYFSVATPQATGRLSARRIR